MKFSVKFLDPTVIVGLDPFSGLAWIAFELVADVVVAAAPEPVLPELLLSSLPQAARPKARITRASNARTLRDRMRRFLLGVGVCWESLSPRGVTARCSAAK